MDNQKQSNDLNNRDVEEQERKLAQWLMQLLHTPDVLHTENESAVGKGKGTERTLEPLPTDAYHPYFYRQLPNFAMALLKQEPQTTIQYASLLYHLLNCPICHQAYLEIYDALSATLQSKEQFPLVNLGTPTLTMTPVRLVVYLSQLLISQAEALLRQARREQTDAAASARSLLQLAMKVSVHIPQSSMRSRALQNLVPVATLFESFTETGEPEQGPVIHSYIPTFAGAGDARLGKIRRGVEAPTRSGSLEASSEQYTIHLQSSILRGTITQQEDTLELHLHDLDQQLRGCYLTITVPLGSLIEPIHWLGGNPRAIRSAVSVDEHGALHTPLGHTDLRLSQPEERNLLEVMFLRLDVRPAS